MQRLYLSLLLIISLFGCNTPEEKEKAPNIIFFLADDLGYGEIGIQGQEKILTPNIDALAKNGMRFTRHYSGAPVCAPARCVLLTGKHTGHAYIRGNDEWRERGEVWDYVKACKDPKLEGQRPIPEGTITIGHLLQKANYQTGIFGKWGLGAPDTEGVPTKQGFDYFYGYNCQRQAHNLFPPHLWENETKILLDNEIVSPRTKLDSLADPNNEASYQKFQQKEYGPTQIHQKAITFIEQNTEEPFFLYYASPLPHLPLQVPQDELALYREKFGDEEPYLGDKGYFPNQHPRATYATMITYLDQQLGDLIATLKATGQYDNTIIFFSSDNGPTYLGGVDVNYFKSANPFSHEHGRTKGFVHEGGIRVPFIVSWPNRIRPNTVSNHISAFYDVLPTLCDIVGVEIPEQIDGISFLPALMNKSQKAHDYLYWEFPSYKGQQAVRMGKWKGIRKNIFEGNMEIELYNLELDSVEQNNIANQHPEVVAQIDSIMKVARKTPAIDRFKFNQLGD